MSIIERVLYIYRVLGIIYSIYSRSLPCSAVQCLSKSTRWVNSPTSLHISDQLGTENVWETLLCWLIVVLWVRKNMYRRERHFGSFHRYSSLLMSGAHVSDCAIELTEAGSRSGTKTSLLERILEINVRSLYRRIYHQLNTTSISDRLQRYVDKMASIRTTADNNTPLPPIPGNQSSHFFPSDSYASRWIIQKVDPNYDAYRRQKWSIKSCIGHKFVCVYGVGCRIVALKSWYL